MIDVIVCVSEPNFKVFHRCIIQLNKQELVNKIIVVYKDWIATNPLLFSNIKLIKEPKKSCLAFARYLGIQASTSEFICFVDSDVILHKNHIKELYENHLRFGGAIEGILTAKDNSRKIPIVNYSYRILKKNERGFTHNTLIKREWITDWKPIFTHAYEDYLLTQHIQNKGYLWVRYPLNCISYHIKDYNIRKRTAWGIAGERIVLQTNKKTIVKRIITHIKRALINPILFKNANYFAYHINISLGIMKGYFGYGNYLILKK